MRERSQSVVLGDEEKATITYNISPGVDLQLSTAWQQSQTLEDVTNAVPFQIQGPEEVLTLVERISEGATNAHFGVLSPPVPVTLNGVKARKSAGIPINAAYFCFAYPLESLSGKYEELVNDEGRCDPWLFFLLLGGFCYFDALKNLIRTNALMLTEAQAKLEMVGPYLPSAEAVERVGLAPP